MPIYTVYHANDLFAAYQHVSTHKPLEREQYHPVAAVEAEALEAVFQLTNSIEQPRWYHRAVTPVPGAVPTRSTSVGDVVVQGRKVWIVDRFGFTETRWVTRSWLPRLFSWMHREEVTR
ncbi:hypothetical protein KSF_065940 [Reticulibacter mediterranei]|uniref:Uncharacterized protein n=1 Tax=Reticulibacter mediterranei TaxID=2778369 RepID=A0A8J3IWD5_9CHLR|nr:hypothetical protein [Reticulibacter mediterranei]GHO96546.1 hypothetical protein KSF_065940 [Reticulibacter mediterranei]